MHAGIHPTPALPKSCCPKHSDQLFTVAGPNKGVDSLAVATGVPPQPKHVPAQCQPGPLREHSWHSSVHSPDSVEPRGRHDAGIAVTVAWQHHPNFLLNGHCTLPMGCSCLMSGCSCLCEQGLCAPGIRDLPAKQCMPYVTAIIFLRRHHNNWNL